MKIRKADQSDLKKMTDLHIISWKQTYSELFPDDYLKNRLATDLKRHWSRIQFQEEDILLVAEEDGTLCGFITVWFRPDPFIDNLHVHPEFKSKKIGLKLMRAAAEKILQKGYTRSYLWVFENNKNAIGFYRHINGRIEKSEVMNIFGFPVSSLKICWDNLSDLFE